MLFAPWIIENPEKLVKVAQVGWMHHAAIFLNFYPDFWRKKRLKILKNVVA